MTDQITPTSQTEPTSLTQNEAILTAQIEELQNIITEQNETIAGLHEKITTLRRVIDGYDKAHAHEKRELWFSLRDKYACAVAQGELASQSETKGIWENPIAYAELVYRFADALMAQRDKKDEPSADCRFCCECLISMPPRTWSVCKCGMCICDNCQCAKCLWTAKPKGKDKKDAD